MIMKKLTRLLSLLLIFGLLSAALPMPVARAATLTVCASGCDHTSINAALAVASSGDTITVGPGLYSEHVVIDKSLALIGTNATIDGGNSGVVVLIKASNVTFQGFLVQQSGMTSSDAGIALLAADNCTLANNTVVNNFVGIAVMSSKNNTLSNNQVADNLYYGVVLEAYPLTPTVYTTGNILSGNTITRSGRDGVYVGELNNNNQILNNTITDTIGLDHPVYGWEANGIYFWKSHGNTVSGNTINGNINSANKVGYGIEMFGAANNTITANTISGNYAGMVVRNSATSPITGNTISTNRINDNVVVNLYADPNFILSIENNWWGTTVESEIVAKLASWVSDDKPDPWLVPGTTVNLDYNPWCANPECTAQVVEVSNAAGLQAALDSAPSGSTIRVNAGTYSQAGAFTINTDRLTLILEDGVVIYNELASCFVVNADYTYILGASKAGAKCRPGWSGSLLSGAHPGIYALEAIHNFVLDGIEIDGSGLQSSSGVYLNSGGSDIQILNNYIHDLSFDGVMSPAISNYGDITGVADVQGNLFLRTSGVEEISDSIINAAYNSWGAYAVTNAMVDPAVLEKVTFAPWTHVELFLASSGTPWADQVVNGNNITYTVSADLQNITGAQFTLKYDAAKLEFVSATPTALFDPMPTDGSGGIRPLLAQTSGEIKYAGWKLAPVSGLNQELFRVTFKALAAGTSNVFIDPASDVFGMSPDSGPSNNVYAAALDTASVKAIDLPAISSTNIQGYYLVGEEQPFSVSLTNPATGGTYAGVLVDLQVTGADLADITSLYYWETALEPDAFAPWVLTPVAGNLVGSFGPPTTGFPMIAPYNATTPFLVTFANAGSYPVVLNLRDVATGTILATYTNTAVVYEKPVITSPDLAGPYVVDTPEPVTLTITNPGLIPAPFSLVFDLPAGTTIVYNSVTYTCTTTCPPIPVLLPAASNDLPFTFTFPAPFSGDITATLFDSDWTPAPRELASLTVAANATVIHTVTGSFTVQESFALDGFFNAYYTGIPVVLTKQETPVGYVYNGITSYPEGQNLSITNVMPGNYKITTNQPRVLNVTAGQNKLVNITGDRDLAPLMLIRGNAFWRDPFTFVPDTIINVQDAGLVGYFFNATGDLDADVNFDGIVNVFDLSIVGGNFDMRSAVVYGGTNWIP